jgi:hypothetical protein
LLGESVTRKENKRCNNFEFKLVGFVKKSKNNNNAFLPLFQTLCVVSIVFSNKIFENPIFWSTNETTYQNNTFLSFVMDKQGTVKPVYNNHLKKAAI